MTDEYHHRQKGNSELLELQFATLKFFDQISVSTNEHVSDEDLRHRHVVRLFLQCLNFIKSVREVDLNKRNSLFF